MTDIKDTFQSVKTIGISMFKDKGSKHFGFAYPVTSEQEVKAYIDALKKEHFNANHHCYAFQIGMENIQLRASDDGEPNNSAGQPILGQIQSMELTNTLVVVVRYFGGTKLGVPGLINAYKTAAFEALQNAELQEIYLTHSFEIQCTFDDLNDVMRMVKLVEAKILKEEYLEGCLFEVEVKRSKVAEMKSFLKEKHKIIIKDM